MAKKFVNGRGEKSDYVRGAFEEPELGGVNPIAGKVGVIVDAEMVRKDNIFEVASFSNVIVLLILVSPRGNKTERTDIREVGGFKDDATTHSER